MAKFITKEEAAKLIPDRATLAVTGFVASNVPETLCSALEDRFIKEGCPRGLTLFSEGGFGHFNFFPDNPEEIRGQDHFAHEGLLAKSITAHYGMAPATGRLIARNKIRAYAIPQGILAQLTHAMAGRKPGIFTKTGIGTYVDPRIDGGKMNLITDEDIVRVMEVDGEEWLFFKSVDLDACFIRCTTADELGNLSMEHDTVITEPLQMAQAVKARDGIVIAEVTRVAKAGTLDPRRVRVPFIVVDYVVVSDERHKSQAYDAFYFNPAACGELRVPVDSINSIPLDQRKTIARRAAMELFPGAIVSLGIGIGEGVAAVAAEEGFDDALTLTVEGGAIGGIPCGGAGFGASINACAMIHQKEQFDFYDGCGVDFCFLGMAEFDESGNVNVSKMPGRVIGSGGFVNISQGAKEAVFCGTLTTGGLKTKIEDGKMVIVQEGGTKKLLPQVEQITYSGNFAVQNKKKVIYITERCVFELRPDGMVLTEIAPGIDLQTHVLDQVVGKIKVSPDLKVMDHRIYLPQPMNIKDEIGVKKRP
ncbi:MAG: acyl CoA:acetate/3-ketoacid CoA transferase [Gracilibacteraceae bacterium]|nr:acyl CoA:acetate/3-ketoacid CoA transferase [Gracilibacteraceae bacterium]